MPCISSLDCTRMLISREKIWGKYQKIQKKKCTSEVYKGGDVAVHLIQQQQHLIYNLHQYGDLPREIWEIGPKILKYIYTSGMCTARGVCMQFLSVLIHHIVICRKNKKLKMCYNTYANYNTNANYGKIVTGVYWGGSLAFRFLLIAFRFLSFLNPPHGDLTCKRGV